MKKRYVFEHSRFRRSVCILLCGMTMLGSLSGENSLNTSVTAYAAETTETTEATETTSTAGSTDTTTASEDSAAAIDAAWKETAVKPASTTLTPSNGTWVKSGTKWKFKTKKGKFVTSSFYKIEGAWYYFNAKGFVKTGLFKVKGNTYYGCKTKASDGVYGDLASGWQTIGKYTYYFSTKKKKGQYGVMATGWKKINKKIYYFSAKGRLALGWKKIGKYTFYFKKTGVPGTKGKMLTGWQTIGSKTYYLRPSGKLGVKGARVQSQWLTINKKKYYFNKSGVVSNTSTSKKAFIKKVGALAQADMKRSGVLASVTIAQAILESNYGSSSLALEANNLFGMKASLSGNNWTSSWTGKTYKKKTAEYLNGKWTTITASFRYYSGYAASVKDHSDYLTGAKTSSGKLRYAGLSGCKSYKKAAQIIKNGGYATAPNYVSRLCAIIKQYDLTKYDK